MKNFLSNLLNDVVAWTAAFIIDHVPPRKGK